MGIGCGCFRNVRKIKDPGPVTRVNLEGPLIPSLPHGIGWVKLMDKTTGITPFLNVINSSIESITKRPF
jgi:hypothetical protein